MNRILTIVLVTACLWACTVRAADFTWDGGAYTGTEATKNWDLAGNWNPDGTPAAGHIALVASSSPYAVANVDLAGSPAVEVATGGQVVQKNGVTLTTPVTLSGGTWSTGPNTNYAWGPDRVLNAPLTVTADSKMTGARGNVLRVNGALSGSGLLTFQGADSYQGDGPDWMLSVADSTFSGGVLLAANNYPVVWASANQALGTGDITIRATGLVRFGASQNYAGAARTPVLYLEGGTTGTSDHLANAMIPFDVVVQAAGGTLGTGAPNYWSNNATYSGTITLNGPLTLGGSRCDSSISMSVTGPITGNFPVTVNTTDHYSGNRGIVALTNAANNFASTVVQMGYLKATSEGALSAGPITIHKPDNYTKLYLNKAVSADWTLANDITSSGILQVEDGSASYTLHCAGSNVTVGTSGTTAATMTVSGNMAFQMDGSTPATLHIDVIGSGDPKVISNDVLAVSRDLSGLASANLNISIHDADFVDLAGQTLTIATCLNDVSGQAFASVTYPDGWKGTLSYGNGFVKIQLGPEGEDRPVLDLSPKSLSFSIKASEPNPAATPVQVKNVGFGTSAWAAAVREPAPSWISLSNATGSDNDSFLVSIDRQGMATGTYTAYVDVVDEGAANSPQTLTVVLQARPDAEASTHSFTNTARGTHPGTLSASSSSVTVNLSSLPADAQIFRAILVPHIGGNSGGYPGDTRSTTPMKIQSADAPGVWLPAFGPRYMTLDCTAAAQRALLAGDKTLRLNVISWNQWYSSQEVRLDVWSTAPTAGSIQQVTGLTVLHRDGDTMLTFAEVNPPVTNPVPTLTELQNAKAAMDTPNEVRYRIYRSSSPIDAITIRTAELVDEISPMSGWNWNITTTSTIPTLPVDDMVFSTPGTGIYVRRAQPAGSAYYAISRVVNGEEDLSLWVPNQNSLAASVAESAGPGMVLQYKQVGPTSFQFVNNATLNYFIRWECPPTWNTPSNPHNYLVAVPPVTVSPRPVYVALHCWGGSMDACYGWWYQAEQGALLVSTNQVPYDWWVGYHENSGTIKPWTNVEGNAGGVVRNFPQKRVWSFVEDFVMERWAVDFNHVFVGGQSMGGSGSSMWGIRAGDKFAYINSWVGVHIPRLTPTFEGSYAGNFGQQSWACLYEDTGLSVWDYWDNDQWLRNHVSTETPFITFANGKNDGGIGWPQAWMMAKACQETRRPHLFKWGQNGHSERAAMPGTLSDRYINIDIDLAATLPAFTYCSIDNNPGDGTPSVGDASGMLNGYLLWQPEDSTDTAAKWEMTCLLISAAPASTCTVDVTPRRCQAFGPRPGMYCEWTNMDIATGTVIESGIVQVDVNGLVNVPQATVSKTKNRIAITIVGDIEPDGSVDVVDLLWFVDAFGSAAGDGNYDAACDLNHDDSVDVVDLLMLVDNFGK
jgi:hypothetical protein